MAGVSSINFGTILSQSISFQFLQQAVHTFATAKNALFNAPAVPNSTTYKTLQSLKSQSSFSGAIANIVTATNAKIDTAVTALEGVDTLLDDAIQLATDSISTPSAANTAALNSLLATIQADLTEAKGSTGVYITAPVANESADPGIDSLSVTNIDSTASIPSSGLTFTVNITDSGSRGTIANVVTNSDASLDNSASFSITGPDGSTGTLAYTTGTSLQTIVDDINELTESTGVTAELDGFTIDLYTTGFGSDKTVTFEEISDPGALLLNGTTSDSGTDVDITVTQGSNTLSITESSRTGITGTLAGVSFEINLYDATILAENTANSNANTFTVFNSGAKIVGSDGKLLATVGAGALDYGSLGIPNDLDLSNSTDAATALNTLLNAQDIVQNSLTTLNTYSNLSSQIATNATNLVTTIDSEITNIETTQATLQLFEDIKNENSLNNALALISLLTGSGGFALSGAGLLSS
ncbi:MAG: hypothetical protein L6Q71_07140 [Planctomycetes bacterium]|nr:hypothetical protein [Planctomycetota bacterium]NUQ34368.1 hypothetical protein [Planctomycetaceae bacterium]